MGTSPSCGPAASPLIPPAGDALRLPPYRSSISPSSQLSACSHHPPPEPHTYPVPVPRGEMVPSHSQAPGPQPWWVLGSLAVTPLFFQAWRSTSLRANSTGSAPRTTPSTAATWTGAGWRSSMPCGTSWARPPPWPSWVRAAGLGARGWSRAGGAGETGRAWGGASPGGLIPSCLPRGQAVVGRSGVREDGHMQQG